MNKLSDSILKQIYEHSNKENGDHFDSEDFYNKYVAHKQNLDKKQFDDCLYDLETKGYIKIDSQFTHDVHEVRSSPTGFQLMEEGKKYCEFQKIEANT